MAMGAAETSGRFQFAAFIVLTLATSAAGDTNDYAWVATTVYTVVGRAMRCVYLAGRADLDPIAQL